jgi:glycosyltransferase involved in cell wall biosynthesis
MLEGLVSIIMPAYNAEAFIGMAIDSVKAQSYTNWELIVVDDGSTDKTSEIIKNYSDPRIYHFQQANAGEAAARNKALSHVNGTYIAFLDADDLYRPEHLEVTVNYLRLHPQYDAVYTDGFYIDENGDIQKPISSCRRGPFEGWIFDEVIRSPDVLGPPGCIVMKSEPIHEENLHFDPSIGYGTDWDFFSHFSENHTFCFCPKHTYLYRVHPNSLTSIVNHQERSSYLAKCSLEKCRSKTIKRQKFQICSLDVQWKVFYDLLFVHQAGFPKRQAAITYSQEFMTLSCAIQANLLRLLASNAILSDVDQSIVKSWMERSSILIPSDKYTLILRMVYRTSPLACKYLIKIKRLLVKTRSPYTSVTSNRHA